MARLDDKLFITVTPKFVVDIKDARLCLALLNMFLKDNKDYVLEFDCVENQVKLVSTRDKAMDILEDDSNG